MMMIYLRWVYLGLVDLCICAWEKEKVYLFSFLSTGMNSSWLFRCVGLRMSLWWRCMPESEKCFITNDWALKVLVQGNFLGLSCMTYVRIFQQSGLATSDCPNLATFWSHAPALLLQSNWEQIPKQLFWLSKRGNIFVCLSVCNQSVLFNQDFSRTMRIIRIFSKKYTICFSSYIPWTESCRMVFTVSLSH